jgi:DNA-binding NtrC family response regulator
MKPCRACAEMIQPPAMKCHFCGEWQLPTVIAPALGCSIPKAVTVLETDLIRRALNETGGNRVRAAEILEIRYPSLLSKIREYGIDSLDAVEVKAINDANDSFVTDAMKLSLTLEEVEREYILRVVEAESGNKTRAAQRLGLDRKTLYRKLEEYGAPDSDPDS